MNLSINSKVELNNGRKMPIFGLGTWLLTGKEVGDSVKWALDAGYRLIDTATIYGNERQIGKAIKSHDISREELFITTKVWNSDQGYKSTLRAFESSLRKLDTDYIDLYLIHWPVSKRLETWKALEELYEEGKTRAIGVSNFTIRHLEELIQKRDIVPAVNQFEFSPFLYNKELLEFCESNQIQLEAYSPLARARKFDNKTIKAIAKKNDKSPAQIMLRWGLQHQIVEIPKSSSESHIKENANIFDFELSSEDMQKLDKLDEDFSVVDDDPYSYE
ncbi:MAG: aldo/keto reductase [Promethearchaeia archaeon]